MHSMLDRGNQDPAVYGTSSAGSPGGCRLLSLHEISAFLIKPPEMVESRDDRTTMLVLTLKVHQSRVSGLGPGQPALCSCQNSLVNTKF